MKDKRATESRELYKLRRFSLPDITSILTSPKSLSALILSPLAVALLGAASRGDILLYAVLAWFNWESIGFSVPSFWNQTNSSQISQTPQVDNSSTADNDVIRSDLDEFLHQYKLDHVYYVVPGAIAFSYVIFFGLGGYLQWHYYIQRRDSSETWKCQPGRFLSKDLERHEVLLGCSNLFLGATLSGILSTLVMNGSNITTLYYNIGDYGLVYFIVTTALTFLYQDASAYYIHRTLHRPFFYKKFHKIHHSYYSPTAFGAVAMHPVEFLALQFALMVPMFVVPVHFLGFLGCVLYTYYYGMIDHSGVDLEAFWPWQPPVRFHDDHHKYFHVNFGFNTLIFDRFHDTLRKKSRFYSENTYGGRGVDKKVLLEKNTKDE